jgi:hypothetical protein
VFHLPLPTAVNAAAVGPVAAVSPVSTGLRAMSINRFHPAVRRIERLGVSTPILVPSFSSRGFPDVNSIFEALRDDLYSVCLLSAFDLTEKRVAVRLPEAADLVVIDSGVYETRPVAAASDGIHPPHSPKDWSRDAYRAFLHSVNAEAAEINTLTVSYDHYGLSRSKLTSHWKTLRVCQPLLPISS